MGTLYVMHAIENKNTKYCRELFLGCSSLNCLRAWVWGLDHTIWGVDFRWSWLGLHHAVYNLFIYFSLYSLIYCRADLPLMTPLSFREKKRIKHINYVVHDDTTSSCSSRCHETRDQICTIPSHNPKHLQSHPPQHCQIQTLCLETTGTQNK